jgi:chromosome segregation ATPase
MNTSALSLSKALETTHSKNATLEAEKEMLSKALDEQKKITTVAQENSEDAQNLITRLQTEKETFEMRSRHLEEELALAKGEMLRLRRQISASKSQKTRILPRTSAPTETSPVPGTSSPTEISTVTRTNVPTETSQAPNEQSVSNRNQNGEVAAGTPYTVKRTTRRRKGGA